MNYLLVSLNSKYEQVSESNKNNNNNINIKSLELNIYVHNDTKEIIQQVNNQDEYDILKFNLYNFILQYLNNGYNGICICYNDTEIYNTIHTQLINICYSICGIYYNINYNNINETWIQIENKFNEYLLYQNITGLNLTDVIICDENNKINNEWYNNNYISKILFTYLNINKQTKSIKSESEIIIKDLNTNISFINSELLKWNFINDKYITNEFIELPKPYYYRHEDNETKILHNIYNLDFTTFYISILLEFNLINENNYYLIKYLFELKNNTTTSKAAKKLLVTYTGNLNSSNSSLYNPL